MHKQLSFGVSNENIRQWALLLDVVQSNSNREGRDFVVDGLVQGELRSELKDWHAVNIVNLNALIYDNYFIWSHSS